jgi:transcriptional regulator with XRE-family HTH domain
MDAESTLSGSLKRNRREKGLTQEQLAERSGLSVVLVAKIEQGTRRSTIDTLAKLAEALDIPLSELLDKRPRLGPDNPDASVLAIRDVILSPALLPGVPADADPERSIALDELTRSVESALQIYRAGDFITLTALLPNLISEARVTAGITGNAGQELLARTYDLACFLLVQFGRDDLASIGAERAVAAAKASNNEVLWALELGTYSWVLLHQGRFGEAEKLAVEAAEGIAGSFSAPAENIAAYGSLMTRASAPAASSGKDVKEYLSAAAAAGVKLGRKIKFHNRLFSSATVYKESCHAHAVRREPGLALEAARQIRPGDLQGVDQARTLLDIAQAHTDASHLAAAVRRLAEARAIAPTWFPHQGVARVLIDDLFEMQSRVSPELRELGAAVDANWYAPYYRR